MLLLLLDSLLSLYRNRAAEETNTMTTLSNSYQVHTTFTTAAFGTRRYTLDILNRTADGAAATAAKFTKPRKGPFTGSIIVTLDGATILTQSF